MSTGSNQDASAHRASGDDGGSDEVVRSSLRYGNPWADAPRARGPLRQLRGHLVLPVTVWLAGDVGGDGAPLTGLTVSSVLLSEGEPPKLAGLVTPSSDLADMIGSSSDRFVVHLLGAAHRRLAQHFAGDLAAPSELLVAEGSLYGPLLVAVGDRAYAAPPRSSPSAGLCSLRPRSKASRSHRRARGWRFTTAPFTS